MANLTIANTDRALVGLDKFHYSILVKDVPTALTYGSMVDVPHTIELNVNTNSSSETLFADNKPAIAYTTVGVVEVSLTKVNLPNEFLMAVLGNKQIGGVRHTTSTQAAPYVGIAWRQLYSDGTYAYCKLFKGKFSEPENNAKTKEDGVEFQTREITANFIATSYEATADDTTKFPYLMATCDETDADYADEGLTWFDYMLSPVSAWVTATVYAIDDVVIQSGTVYKCLVGHTSGVFATDLSAAKWIAV